MSSPARRSISNAIKNFQKLRSDPQPVYKTFFTQNHQWIRINQSKLETEMQGGMCNAKIGLTDYYQDKLGYVNKVYVDDVTLNEKLTQGTDFLSIKHTNLESDPKILDIELPINCKIVEVNPDLKDIPRVINRSAENDGWICSIEGNRDDIENLMSKEEYEKYIKRR